MTLDERYERCDNQFKAIGDRYNVNLCKGNTDIAVALHNVFRSLYLKWMV